MTRNDMLVREFRAIFPTAETITADIRADAIYVRVDGTLYYVLLDADADKLYFRSSSAYAVTIEFPSDW